MQERVLFSLMNGVSAAEIAAKEGTTVDTIRHIKSTLSKVIRASLGDDIPNIKYIQIDMQVFCKIFRASCDFLPIMPSGVLLLVVAYSVKMTQI